MVTVVLHFSKIQVPISNVEHNQVYVEQLEVILLIIEEDNFRVVYNKNTEILLEVAVMEIEVSEQITDMLLSEIDRHYGIYEAGEVHS